MVDELHDYKNLETPSNIPGAGIQGSNRASDLHMKTEFLRQREGRRVITGATATPIANSVTEMYVMQRYLRPDLLQAAGIQDFNTWATTFGQVVEEMELSVAGGDRFKLKSRFAKFQNVPELLKMFHTFADVKTAEDLKLPVPALAARDGDGLRQPNMITVEPSPELREYIQDIGKRVDAIQQRLVDAEEDNMLKVSSDGRKAALDMRLVDPALSQQGPTKISATADLLASVYEEHKDRTYTDPKTGEPDPVPGALQLVFCDFGTPSDRWNVYGELKDQLRRRGVPEHLVRFIHDAKNDTDKGRLFAAARSGQIAVLMGSTSNGRRHQHSKTRRTSGGHGRPMAALRRRTTPRPHSAPRQSEPRGPHLPGGHQGILRFLHVAGTGTKVPVHQPDYARTPGRARNRRHRGQHPELRPGQSHHQR